MLELNGHICEMFELNGHIRALLDCFCACAQVHSTATTTLRDPAEKLVPSSSVHGALLAPLQMHREPQTRVTHGYMDTLRILGTFGIRIPDTWYPRYPLSIRVYGYF